MNELDTKEKIRKAAEGLFTKYGIRSISMDEIARHLSVSKKTLYQHFADKDELVTLVIQGHMQEMKGFYEELTEKSSNAIDELHQISLCLKRDMEDMNPSLLFDIQKFHPKAWNVWADHKHDFIHKSIVRNIEQGIKEGNFRPEINAHVLAKLRLANIENSFDDRIFPRDKFSIVEVQTQFFEHFVYGLCTDKGRKLYQKYKENHQPINTTKK
jgi:AcrR family transcriptional regulator